VYIIYQFLPPCTFEYAGSAYGRATTKECKANWQRMAFTGVFSPLPLPSLTLPSGHYSICNCNAAAASIYATLPCYPPTSKVPGPSPSAVLLQDSPNHLPCHLLCVGVVLGRCTQGGGDTSMPICALSFASDAVGGPNAASKHHGANPSIASTSAAYKKRRGGHVNIDDDSSASLLPQSKKKTARKKSATKRRCSSSIAQTSASKKKRS
jgi:hypothetical protein